MGFKDLQPAGTKALEREIQSSVSSTSCSGGRASSTRSHYESGLIDDSFSFSYNSEDAFGFSLIGAECDEPERLAEEVLLELHRARKDP